MEDSDLSKSLWAGRSKGRLDDIAVEMGQSISLDIQLYREDIMGSIAHSAMLEKIGILTGSENEQIQKGLQTIRKEIETGNFPLRPELEDIHTHVETRLIELIGESAKKLHTGRSRNDQIAVDTHLFVRSACRKTSAEILAFCRALKDQAEQNIESVIPGYTHLQVAQPVRLSHHLLSHFWAFLRDFDRFQAAAISSDRLPLGSGALGGVNYASDREFLRTALGFGSIYPNSMDAVSSRDHILDFLYACAVFAAHASRLAEEIILWSSVEFSFISLPDELTTGSSIMPQKKNPDFAELSRGKAGRIFANLTNLLTSLKGLPLTYNRDLQEDRFPLLDSAEQTSLVCRSMTAMVRKMKFFPENMKTSLEKGYAAATDLADALVKEKNIPFREAHHLVGKLVSECIRTGKSLTGIGQTERKAVCSHFADEKFYAGAVDLKASADKKISYGGTAKHRQKEQLGEAAAAIAQRDKIIWPDEPDNGE